MKPPEGINIDMCLIATEYRSVFDGVHLILTVEKKPDAGSFDETLEVFVEYPDGPDTLDNGAKGQWFNVEDLEDWEGNEQAWDCVIETIKNHGDTW